MQPDVQVGVAQYGGRLIPRSVVEENNDELTAVFRKISNDGGGVITIALNVSKKVAGDVYNADLPAWRDARISVVLPPSVKISPPFSPSKLQAKFTPKSFSPPANRPWNFTAPVSDMIALQRKMTDEYIPLLKALTPGSGVYMNEADFREQDWQQTFFGANYGRLLSIKKKYDPKSIFYAPTAVGSNEWKVDSRGALCKI